MARLLPLAALLLLAAPLPAASSTQEGACVPHRDGELRCAVQFNPSGASRFTIHFDAYAAARNAQGALDVWTSPCGIAGQRNFTGVSVGGGGTLQVGRANVVTLMNTCFEAFVTRCTVGGRATPCPTAFPPGTAQLRVVRD